MRVAIAKAGLAKYSCAKYRFDAGHTPIVLDSRNVVKKGLVAAWQHEYFHRVKTLEKLAVVNWQQWLECKRGVEFNCDRSLWEFVITEVAAWLNQFVSKILQATNRCQFESDFGKNYYINLLKHCVVKPPCQNDGLAPTPTRNFYLSKSNTMQPNLGSMEGAVLSGKLTKLEEAPSLYGGVSLTAQAINTAHQSANSNSLQTQNIQPATNAATA